MRGTAGWAWLGAVLLVGWAPGAAAAEMPSLEASVGVGILVCPQPVGSCLSDEEFLETERATS
jgi:hypothetical protein